MARFFLAILSLAAAAGVSESGRAAPQASLRAAQDAYVQLRVAEAEKGFEAVLGDPAAAKADRSAAGLGLARIQWLVDRDASRALATLERARATGEGLCDLSRYGTRVLREAEKPRDAEAFAQSHETDCQGSIQTARIHVERVKAAVDLAAQSRGPDKDQALDDARSLLNALPSLVKLAPDAARLKFALAVLSSDAPGALDGWRSYFWLTDHNAPPSFKADDVEIAALFNRALAPEPALADEIAFERLLVRAGFLTEAKRYDAAHRVAERTGADPAYKPVSVYFAFRARFDDVTLKFNRAFARGKGDQDAYEAEAKRLLSDAAAQLGSGDPRSVLGDSFGLVGMVGRTGGVASVHIGHTVEDTSYHVQQYGRQGEVRFIAIDNLASNGYQSWLWDGVFGQTGGWSNDAGAIVQVRPAYTPGPLSDLASFDPVLAARFDTDLKRFEQQDLEALKTRPIVFLPGLQARLAREAREQVAAKARAEAARTGEPYERVFLKDDWDASVGHSIYAHEGRHALDHAEFKGPKRLSGSELEYRAKLSELELGEFPRMPLATILSSDLGSDSSHGKADERIMQGLVTWIEAHRPEVAGFDASVPAAEQIDKLSDDQMRLIAKGLDPYFTEHPDQR